MELQEIKIGEYIIFTSKKQVKQILKKFHKLGVYFNDLTKEDYKEITILKHEHAGFVWGKASDIPFDAKIWYASEFISKYPSKKQLLKIIEKMDKDNKFIIKHIHIWAKKIEKLEEGFAIMGFDILNNNTEKINAEKLSEINKSFIGNESTRLEVDFDKVESKEAQPNEIDFSKAGLIVESESENIIAVTNGNCYRNTFCGTILTKNGKGYFITHFEKNKFKLRTEPITLKNE